jgi:hypothetical protein
VRKRDLFLLPMTVIVACGGTLWGGHNTHIALENRAPVEVSCADYLRQRPQAAWLRLTRCFPSFSLAVESSKQTNAVYIPLHARPARGSVDFTKILLVSDDADMLSLASPLSDGVSDQLVTAPLSDSVSDQLVAELFTSVEGLVESRLSLRFIQFKAELASLDLPLYDDFVIINRGERPRPLWFAIGEFALGLSALYLLVRRIRRWWSSGEPQLPRATLARDRATGNATGPNTARANA